MKLRRYLCAVLALAFIFVLAGCSEGKLEDKLDETLNGEQSPSDGSDNDAGTNDGDDTDGDSDDGEAEEIDYMQFSNGLDERGFFTGITATDCVELPDYRSLVKPDAAKLTDRAVEDGDFVNIDYVGSIDGVEFDGGSTQGAGTEVVIGVTSYIDDFLQQIIGHKPGENFDIEVTFPENYQNTDLAGKDAVFNITVNYIWDITEELAKSLGYESRSSMANYVGMGYTSVESDLAGGASNYVIGLVTVKDLPESVIENLKEKLVLQVKDQASMYGIDADTFVTYSGYNSAQEYADDLAEGQAKWSLTMQAIAELEGLEVTVDDIAQAGAEAAVDVYGQPFIAFSLLSEKVSSFLDQVMTPTETQ